MSDGEDKDSKSNEPTEKKISDTIAKGSVPVSREVPVMLSFLAIFIICSLLIAPMVGSVTKMLEILFEGIGTLKLDSSSDSNKLFSSISQEVWLLLAPILLIFMAAGILASLIQNPFQLNLERIIPQFSRVSPAAGFKRIFGLRGLGDVVKSFFKFSSVGLIVVLIIKSQAQSTMTMMIRPPQFIPLVLRELVLKLVGSVAIVALVLAVVDTIWSRITWRRDLRMSHREIKEEYKDAEGNPAIKGRARSIARQRASRRMMSAVPNATLVIANPTHYAIALRYVRSEGGAPLVVAKGKDIIALKIRKVAEDLDIAVIENKVLARAMYEKVEVDSEIPQEFFVAVAELIHFLQMRSMVRAVNP